MKDLVELEYKKIELENKWRSEFERLKDLFTGCSEGDNDDIMAEIVLIKEKSESCKLFLFVKQIELWIKGERVYDLDEYLTHKELEQIIDCDRYYLKKEFIHESFFDKDTFSTMLTSQALLDQWIAKGLPFIEGCPWTKPPRWDYSYQHDCNDYRSFCVKVGSIRHFLSIHKLPVPAAIFPDDSQNTTFTLGRIERTMETFAMMRSREREMLELKELRIKSEYFVNKVQAEALAAPEVRATLNESTTISATADVDTPETLIARLRDEGVEELRELAARVDKDFPGLSDADLGELLPARPGTNVSWHAKNSRGRRLRGKK